MFKMMGCMFVLGVKGSETPFYSSLIIKRASQDQTHTDQQTTQRVEQYRNAPSFSPFPFLVPALSFSALIFPSPSEAVSWYCALMVGWPCCAVIVWVLCHVPLSTFLLSLKTVGNPCPARFLLSLPHNLFEGGCTL